jgi:hypothetical protein
LPPIAHMNRIIWVYIYIAYFFPSQHPSCKGSSSSIPIYLQTVSNAMPLDWWLVRAKCPLKIA